MLFPELDAVLLVEFAATYQQFVYDALNASYTFANSLKPNDWIAVFVKSYATDFCGVKTLREATREQVENFVKELSEWAVKDRNALLCQLNSYARPKQEGVA